MRSDDPAMTATASKSRAVELPITKGNYRNRKLLDAARDRPCVLCGSIGTTVASHSNALSHGRGMGLKSHGAMIAFLCGGCHDLTDGRAGKLTKDEKRALWLEGWARTMMYLFDVGLVIVNDKPK